MDIVRASFILLFPKGVHVSHEFSLFALTNSFRCERGRRLIEPKGIGYLDRDNKVDKRVETTAIRLPPVALSVRNVRKQ